MEHDKEIQDIRAEVDYERANLELLSRKISDPGLKQHIADALSSLEDVEQILEDVKQSMEQQISEDQLMAARAFLQIATKQRTILEKLLEKYRR